MTERSRAVPDATRPFLVAVALAVALSAAFAAVLAGPFDAAVRETVSTIGFVVGALAIVVSGGLAARRCEGRRRRAWTILAGAAAVALAGNVWTTLDGGDPVLNPSLVGDVLLAIALVMTVFGLLVLSDAPSRRARLLVNWLDGVVTGCAVLIMAIVLVFSRLVAAENIADRPSMILFPLLDVAVLTVAFLLVVRNQGDRSFYSMVCGGFVLWSVADLLFAVQNAQGAFVVGTSLDLLWITAYLVLAASAWHPAATGRSTPAPVSRAGLDVQATLLVFSLLLLAAGVQTLFAQGPLTQILTALWMVLVLAVGVRQVLLVADNQVLRDSLERRVAEQTADLRRMKRRTEAMLTSVGDGIYVVDLEGRISFATPSTLLAVGYDPEDLTDVPAHDLLHVEPLGAPDEEGIHDASGCYITRAITEGQVVSSHADRYRRADGTTFPVEVTASPLVDDDVIIGAVVVFRDVTERREVDRMKDEFLSIVSHELRTPLTSIRGSLGMLSSGAFDELPAPALRMLNIATRSSDRLIRLINDILDIERIRSGRLPMECEPVEVATLVDIAVREMDGLAEAAQVRLEVHACSGLVSADADRVVQTLTNVIGNAVKFSPRGSTVTIRVTDGALGTSGCDEVVLQVQDTGRGVPADMLETIFEPFEQVDSSDSRAQGGTGLGLAISRGIVERHGGRIWAESEVGVGTTVSFTLLHAHQPLRQGDAAEA